MSNVNTCLISKENGRLQIPYADYEKLMRKVQEGRRLLQAKESVIADLKKFLGGNVAAESIVESVAAAKAVQAVAPVVASVSEPVKEPEVKKVAIEFDADAALADVKEDAVAEETVAAKAKKAAVPKARTVAEDLNVPPIKNDIAAHFNKLDESGRLFSVFKQYYICLNDMCGGTVRVTMKDGFCSLWNYDEWEEFAFVDIFEGHLRVSIDPRYTGEMQSLDFCEVPRLLSSRRNLVSVQVDDLSNTMLELLVKAFAEVGLTAN